MPDDDADGNEDTGLTWEEVLESVLEGVTFEYQVVVLGPRRGAGRAPTAPVTPNSKNVFLAARVYRSGKITPVGADRKTYGEAASDVSALKGMQRLNGT